MEIIDQPGTSQASYMSMEELGRRGYRFAFDTYFNTVVDLLKNNAGTYVLSTLLCLTISFIAGMLPVIGSFARIFLTPGFYGGYLLISQKALRKEDPGVSDLFAGFRGAHYGRSLVTYLLMLLILAASSVLLVPIILAAGPDFELMQRFTEDFRSGIEPDLDILLGFFESPQVLWLAVIGIIPFIYASICLSLSLAFVVIYGSTPMEAIRNSFQVVSKSWWWFLAYIWLLGTCAWLGIFALCVGLLLTYPLPFIGTFVSFDMIMKGTHAQNP